MSAAEDLKAAERLLVEEVERANLQVDNLGAEYDAQRERLAAAIAARNELRNDLNAVQRSIRIFEPKGATA